MAEHQGAGAGAFEVGDRIVAVRLRRLKAAGASNEELLAALDEGSTSWHKGGHGEAEVGRVLDECAEVSGFATLHDLTAPGERANVDHIVVGANGVAVIDAKAWSGPVRVTTAGLRIKGWSKRRELQSIEAQVARVDALLRSHGLVLPVRGFLCLANRNEGIAQRCVTRVGSVGIGTPEGIARALAQGNATSRAEAEAAVSALTSGLSARAVRPVGDLITAVPVAPVVAPPPARRMRRVRPRPGRRRRRRRGGESVGFLLLRLAVVIALFFGLKSSLDKNRTRAPLTSAQVERLLPHLRQRADDRAGGRTRLVSRARASSTTTVRYRRGDCRIVFKLDRVVDRSAADASMLAGKGCREH